MRAINRRDAVLAAGGLAGLAALSPGRAWAAAGPGPDARAVLDRIRLTGGDEAGFLARLGQPACRPTPLPNGASPRPAADIEGRVVVRADAGGRPIAYGLWFACTPRVLNRFTVGGEPLAARRFCFSAGDIAWTPGRGFPVYAAYAPRYEYAPAAYYREAKAHQLVPVVEGAGYFTGCQPADVCEAPAAGPVGFDVNDTHYDDNDGSYVVTVWSWS